MGRSDETQERTCPIFKGECTAEACAAWIVLDDFEGCPLDLAGKAVNNVAETFLKPLARKADEIVKRYLKDQGRRR